MRNTDVSMIRTFTLKYSIVHPKITVTRKKTSEILG